MSITPYSSQSYSSQTRVQVGNIEKREEGSLDEGEIDTKVEKVALNLLRREIEVPIQSLKEKSDYFFKVLDSNFKEGIEKRFDFTELNRKFPHLEKAIDVLFLEDKDFESLTARQLRDIVKVAEYFGSDKALENFMNELRAHILEKCSRMNLPEGKVSCLLNMNCGKPFDFVACFYDLMDCDNIQSEFGLLIAEFIYESRVYRKNLSNKNKFCFYLAEFYLSIGAREQALKLFDCFIPFLPKEPQVDELSLIEIFCRNWCCITAEDIFRCIDLLPSDDHKNYGLYRFIDTFEKQTDETLQEVANRLKTSGNSHLKPIVLRKLGAFYSRMGKRKQALEIIEYFRSYFVGDISWIYYSQFSDLIHAFCKNSSYFTSEDIFRCIDLLKTDVQKGECLFYFLEYFKEQTDETLEEAAKRVESLEDSYWKEGALRELEKVKINMTH